MNTKRRYHPPSDHKPAEYLHEVGVTRGGKVYLITKGTLLSVNRRPGLQSGKYEFLYAERVNGTILYYVEGPDRRIVSERQRKTLREADIKTVHIKTRRTRE